MRGCVYAVLHPAFFSRDQRRQDENPASTLALFLYCATLSMNDYQHRSAYLLAEVLVQYVPVQCSTTTSMLFHSNHTHQASHHTLIYHALTDQATDGICWATPSEADGK